MKKEEDTEDSGYFVTQQFYEEHSVLHCTFEQTLRNKMDELNRQKLAGSINTDVSTVDILENTNTNESTKKKAKVEKCVRMIRPDGYYVFLKPKIPFPRPSMFKHSQQVEYLTMRSRAVTTGSQTGSAMFSSTQKSMYLELRAQVVSEQSDFIKYLRDSFDKLKADYEYVDIVGQRYVQSLLDKRKQRLTKVPQYYNVTSTVSLVLPSDGGTYANVRLRCDKAVLNVGPVPKVVIPALHQDKKHKVRATVENHNDLYTRFPVISKCSRFDKSMCSNDYNCAALATKFRCDVVTAGSSLVTLMSSLHGTYTHSWLMPLELRQYDVIDNNVPSVHSILYVNKPYQLTNLKPQDKNRLYHKTGLKLALTMATSAPYTPTKKLPPHPHFRLRTKQSLAQGAVRKDPAPLTDIFDAPDVADLETFGTISTKSSVAATRESSARKITTESESSSAPKRVDRKRPGVFGATSPTRKSAKSSLMDLVKPDAMTCLEDTGGRRPATTSADVTNSALDGILASQSKLFTDNAEVKKNKEPSVDVELENVAGYVQWRPPHNSSYSTWNLGDLRLLVRTNQNGHLRDVSSNKTKPVYLVPKMEYQPTLGGEVDTLDECTRMWILSYIRHKCPVLRARIHAYTSEILSVDGLNHQNLLPPGCPYSPEHAQVLLHHILSQILNLPLGSYLLRYTAGAAHIDVMSSSKARTGEVYDLRKAMEQEAQLESEAPPRWLPIDCDLEMFYHKLFNRIPGTFEPADGIKIHCTNTKNKNKGGKKKAKKK